MRQLCALYAPHARNATNTIYVVFRRCIFLGARACDCVSVRLSVPMCVCVKMRVRARVQLRACVCGRVRGEGKHGCVGV